LTVANNGKIVLGENSIIEYAKTGITTYSSIELKTSVEAPPGGIIQHCRDFGLYIYNADPPVTYLKFISNGAPGYPNTAGIHAYGTSTSLIVDKVTISGSSKGFLLDGLADATLRYSKIESSCTDNIVTGTNSGLILYGGNNNILTGSGYAIDNAIGSDDVNASGNYFSIQRFRYPGKIFGSFALTPYNNGAPKVAGPYVELDGFERARTREDIGDWSGAMNEYRSILAETTKTSMKRSAVKAILRVSERRNLENKTSDYTEIRSIIQTELQSATSDYKAVLDYLLCEILLKEGKHADAVKAFTDTAARYSGTSMEVEMLARIATIYGLYLHDTRKAREYADAAAAINPGQGCLYIAYRTAGVDYQPWKYADRYKGIRENFDTPPEQPETATESEYITVSPNPANPVTTISYSLKNSSDVRLTVYAVNGQKVATLVNGPMRAGTHSVTFNGAKLASGVYFYRFESAGLTKAGKMLLLK
jgi:hypothetical protein